MRIEREIRSKAGEAPDADEFHRRFPEDRAVVEAVCGARPHGAGRSSKPAAGADRNLLFGILALQMDFIGRDELVAAMNAWVLEKSKPLGRLLVERGAMTEAEFSLLEPLVARHVERHGGDPERSLASLDAGPSTREVLARVEDPDIQASLLRVAPCPSGDDHDPDATVSSYSAGTPTSVGTRFRVLRFHAKGGLGFVSVALDAELDREVALKEIQDKYADDPESRSRFVLEAEITGRLEHPGIVPVYGLGHYADGRPFYAMRFIRGDSLKRGHPSLPPGRRRPPPRPGRAGAAAPRAARPVPRRLQRDRLRPQPRRPAPRPQARQHHARPVRRDAGGGLGPGQADRAVPTRRPRRRADRCAYQTGRRGPRQTRRWARSGTPAYMSPEQAEGRLDRLGPASDVYSLGATLYHLLTGQAAVRAEDGERDDAAKSQRGDFPPPRRSSPTSPRPLEAVCLKAMAVQPEDRYALAAGPGRRPRALAGRRAGLGLARAVASTGAPLGLSASHAGGGDGGGLADRADRRRRRLDAVPTARTSPARRRGPRGVRGAERGPGRRRRARASADLARWGDAASAARRARSLLASGGGDAALHREVESIAVSIRGRCRRGPSRRRGRRPRPPHGGRSRRSPTPVRERHQGW